MAARPKLTFTLSLSQLSMNEDFSFVRFLKVVKTLYESSTFTQLGRTVGSALNPLSTPSYSTKLDEETSRKSGRGGKRGVKEGGSESIFDAFADACIPSSKTADAKDMKSFDDQGKPRRDTLFEQVIKGCSLLASPVAEEFSDEETFKTRTDEEDFSYYSEGESFETMEDDYSSPRSARRKRRH